MLPRDQPELVRLLVLESYRVDDDVWRVANHRSRSTLIRSVNGNQSDTGRDETKEGSPLFTSEGGGACVRCEPDIIQGSRDRGVGSLLCRNSSAFCSDRRGQIAVCSEHQGRGMSTDFDINSCDSPSIGTQRLILAVIDTVSQTPEANRRLISSLTQARSPSKHIAGRCDNGRMASRVSSRAYSVKFHET
jgi:hypothetical protein